MHRYMHQVFEAMMEPKLLSPSATPGTKKEFEDITDTFKCYSNFIHCHLLAFMKPLDWTRSFNGMNQRHLRPG